MSSLRLLGGVPLKKALWIAAAVVAVVGLALGAWLVRPFWRLSANFGDRAERAVIEGGDHLQLSDADPAGYRQVVSRFLGRFRRVVR